VSSRHPKRPLSWYHRLLPEQKDAADFVIKEGCVGLFSQQRTGKTFISMAVLEKLHWPTVLIVAPLTAVDLVWVTALQQSPYLICRNREELKGASGPVALVVHWQLFTKTSKQLAKLPWQVLIIDESQGLKNRNSLQSRAARRFRDAVPRRIALSGTPIDESEIDVWSQMRFIDHTVLGEDWTPFAEEYCYKAGFMGHEWRFNKDKQRQFLDKLSIHAP